jgi:hypothetical protein
MDTVFLFMGPIRYPVIRWVMEKENPTQITDFCVIKGCDNEIRSVGFCAHHYDIWNRYGHPLALTLVRTVTPKNKERHAWHAIKARCFNTKAQNYAGYGGRGITVCDRWLVLENFLSDMGPAPLGSSIERLDNNGHYEPSNCKWATWAEQARNKRHTKLNIAIVAQAKAEKAKGVSIAQIARDLGLKYDTVYQAVTGQSWADVEAAPDG